ncbi:S-layer domain protein [Chondrocystis sp. NIES-4102]|nr:S-layer domain protein [Chondrocystis sp. NIES-4102]
MKNPNNVQIFKKILFYGIVTLSLFSFQAITNSNPVLSQAANLENFTDITGIEGEKEINDLTQLGVIEATSNQFQPSTAITRGEYIAWLVKTYNELHKYPIALPVNYMDAFPDVAPSHSHSIYIQAAYDAGFLAGFADGTFRPDEVLTREQAIAIKARFDTTRSGKDSRPADKLRIFMEKTKGFQDAASMSDEFVPYLAFDFGNAAGGRNFQRVYGTTTIYAPQKPVTKAEAAILLSKFRKGKSIEEVLKNK